MKTIKHLISIPVYLFLVFSGFIGWGDKDRWDDFVKWAKIRRKMYE